MKLSTCLTVFSYLQSFDTVSCECDAHHVSLRQAVGTDGLPWCYGLPDRHIKFKGLWITDALPLCSVGLKALSSALVCEFPLRCLDWHGSWSPGRRNRCSALVFRRPDSNLSKSISYICCYDFRERANFHWFPRKGASSVEHAAVASHQRAEVSTRRNLHGPLD